jgi:hypothetical protein
MKRSMLSLVFAFVLLCPAIFSIGYALDGETYCTSLPPLPPPELPPATTSTRYEVIEECCSSEYGVDVSFFSRYLWRGLQMSQGHPVSQQDIWVSYGDFKLMVFGNFDLDDKRYDQFNYYIDYSSDFGTGFLMAIGAIYYDFLHQKKPYFLTCFRNSQENCCGLNSSSSSSSSSSNENICGACYSLEENVCNLAATKNVVVYKNRRQATEFYFSFLLGGRFSPVFTIYRSWGHIRGYSLTASAEYCTDHLCFGDKIYMVNMMVEGDISWRSHGYNKEYYGVSKNSIADVNVAVSFPLSWHDFIIAPMVKANTLVPYKFRDKFPHSSAHIAYGVMLSGSW